MKRGGRQSSQTNTGTISRPVKSNNTSIRTNNNSSPANMTANLSSFSGFASPAAAISGSNAETNNGVSCGTCSCLVGEGDSYECDRCLIWTHAAKKCSGLPAEAFRVISKYAKSGATYVCTKCRLNPSIRGAQGSQAVDHSQLFEIVKSLSSTVERLSEEVKGLKLQNVALAGSQGAGASHPIQPVVPSEPEIRKIILEEAREVREREKRAKSIIVRGLGDDHSNLQAKFDGVVSFLFSGENRPHIILSEIVPINRNLVRAKVVNDIHRRELLLRTKNLKNSEFDGVHVKRDLTFNQRNDLKKRIAQFRSRIPEQTQREVIHSQPPNRRPSISAGAVGISVNTVPPQVASSVAGPADNLLGSPSFPSTPVGHLTLPEVRNLNLA